MFYLASNHSKKSVLTYPIFLQSTFSFFSGNDTKSYLIKPAKDNILSDCNSFPRIGQLIRSLELICPIQGN